MRPSAVAANPLIAAPIVAFAPCDFYCRSCGWLMHDIVTAVESNAYSAHLENCNPGTCGGHICGGDTFAARVQSLWLAVQKTAPEKLPALVSANADAIAFNAERGAVQFRCEKGMLVASLPLTSDQIVALQSP